MITNKKARQYCLALDNFVQFVTPHPQSSNFLIKDLINIREFVKEYSI